MEAAVPLALGSPAPERILEANWLDISLAEFKQKDNGGPLGPLVL